MFYRAAVHMEGCYFAKKLINVTIDPGEYGMVTSGICNLTLVWEGRMTHCKTSVDVNLAYPLEFWMEAYGVRVTAHSVKLYDPLPGGNPPTYYWKPLTCAYKYQPSA
ncbi:hypothetical protein R1flu_011860 [Riccia fluitans]|uniref:Uncharacterized protein n=1 Tax=Riccia fluitans TaxID=41844 RepID=A0ABD1Z975_9MARC